MRNQKPRLLVEILTAILVFGQLLPASPIGTRPRFPPQPKPTVAEPEAAPASDQAASRIDWSRALVDSTMKRYPNPADLGPWAYARSLYLYGQYLVWKRTG